MAGIYIHIPFCRQKCYYCDFYKTTNSSGTSKFLSALEQEAELRKNYLNEDNVNTIYFGGGTPSVLKQEELAGIMHFLYRLYQVMPDAEITFEANPDDLTPEYLLALKQAGINRLSIGIQSFNNELLQKMNRRHDAHQAREAIENAFNSGFSNLSADLIYGLPGLTSRQWKHDLREMFRLPVVHLSAYHLTYHQGTPFYTWLKKGTLKELSETTSIEQFNILLDETAEAGFEQYEISNFARSHNYSLHNKAYWFGDTYLGLGPSAHSFDGISRQWNVSHLDAYINGIFKKIPYYEREMLTANDRFNEYILTRIRTRWGISYSEIRELFGTEIAEATGKKADTFISSGKIVQQEGRYLLTREGLFISDTLMAEFMLI
jgi:oxygen-independent coproporphyrinogen III oxidase